jgi:alcohol oxidase
MKLDSKTASFYYSRPSEWLGGRRAVVPCAHILGGGSSINFMVCLSFHVTTSFEQSY